MELGKSVWDSVDKVVNIKIGKSVCWSLSKSDYYSLIGLVSNFISILVSNSVSNSVNNSVFNSIINKLYEIR